MQERTRMSAWLFLSYSVSGPLSIFFCMSRGCRPALLRWNSFRFSARIAFHRIFSSIVFGTNNVSPSVVSPLFQLSNWFALAALSNNVFVRYRSSFIPTASHSLVGMIMRDVLLYIVLFCQVVTILRTGIRGICTRTFSFSVCILVS